MSTLRALSPSSSSFSYVDQKVLEFQVFRNTLRALSRSSSSFSRADTSTGLALPKGLERAAAGAAGRT